MKLGTRGRYAVMAVVDMAIHADTQPISLSDIGARQDLPVNYLEQLFKQLKNQGIVVSIRGAAGGYVLGRPLNAITIADIIQAVEEPMRSTRCVPGGSGCMKDKTRCIVHDLWDGLDTRVLAYLSQMTLADTLKTHKVCGTKIREALTP